MSGKYNMITVLGATAGGKTTLATNLARHFNGEIIGADSRQVYKSMDLGTGKDYDDYIIDGKQRPDHLIDIVDAGYKYNVYEYQGDFIKVFTDIKNREVFPVLCGGSGLYIEAVLKGYHLIQVPVNDILRSELENKNLEELSIILSKYKQQHNTSDIDSQKRAVRAIEIADHYSKHKQEETTEYPEINSLNIGVKFDRDSRRRRITQRLRERLKEGMIDEVQGILDKGVDPEILKYYGLEYKFLTQFILNEITYDEMFQSLNTAIHQFAKRQMTWFRRMEKNGTKIHWLDGYIPTEKKVERVVELFNQ